MKTKILTNNDISSAANLLKQGGIVAIPTETVYGLAADANNEHAISKIFKAKNRPQNHPLIVHISSVEQIYDWAKNFNIYAQKLAKNFWPGPLTLILPKQDNIHDIITGGMSKIAIRIPDNNIALEVIKQLGNGIVAPSANIHKKISPTKVSHVLKTLDGRIDAIIDGGNCSIGIESTIVDLTGITPKILRLGVISKDDIEKILGINVLSPANHYENVPGNMQVHYQPNTPLYIFNKDKINELFEEDNIGIIHYSNICKNKKYKYYQLSEDKLEYCQKLYEALHHMDDLGLERIIIESAPDSEEWSDVKDRILKASLR